MAKRMAAKEFKLKKQKRMRRAYLKKYSGMIKVGQSIDKTKVPRGMEGIVDYRHRGNTFWDDYLEAKFPSKGMVSARRQACIDRLNEITQEVIPEMNVVMSRGGITKTIIRFYFSSDYTTCFFMKEDWLGMVMYKSGVYGSKDRAMFNYNNNSINWLTRIDLPQIYDPLPG